MNITNACRAVPPACTLFMTSSCNLACAWCRRAKIGTMQTPPVTLALVRRLLDRYPALGAFAMAGQGEPTLAPEFSAIARYLAEQGKRIILDTNGVNSRQIAALKGCFTRISLSLYGHDAASFKAYTGVDAFKAVMDSWQAYKEACAEVTISFIVDKDDLTSLEGVLRLCDQLEPARLLLYNPLCYDDADKAQLAKIITAQDEDVIRAIADLTCARSYPVDLPPYPDYAASPNSCRSYCAVINLDGNGNIGGCLRKVTPDAKFGNISSDPDPFNSPEMLRLRRRQLVGLNPHPECASCFGNWGYGDSRSLVWKKDLT